MRFSPKFITRSRADWSFVGNVEIAYPSREEQEHIVRFLDRVDRLVDRLIDTKQRLIEVLTEQKQSIIHCAVTRGLDPAVPMKRTGLDWLPEVPEHWEIAPLRLRYSIELGKMLDAKRITGQHLVPYLRNVDVQWDHVNTTDLPTMDIEAREFPRYTLRKGDMLVCEGGEVGRSAFYFGELRVCGFQKALHRVRVLHPAKDAPRFLYYLMYAAAKFGLFQASGSENTIAHLTGEKLRAQRFPIPPREEQQKIAFHIDKATRDIEKAIERARREIELVREYRTRLISDVVTGKLDVREEKKATKPKKANKHFHRAVLAAEIVDQYQKLSKFGWIKLQKAVILAERHLEMDEIQSEPKRAVAGPFDNPMMRSIHKQLAAQKWFEPVKGRRGYTYAPMEKRGGHRTYFETYWGDKRDEFDRLLKLLKPLNTDRAEIVATLYMAWNDFLILGEPVDDDKLVHEVLHNWDDSKRRFPEDRWRRAISWMRENALVPQGFGTVTTVGLRNAAD